MKSMDNTPMKSVHLFFRNHCPNITDETPPTIGLQDIDYLILIAVLVCSIGISLSRSINSNSTTPSNESIAGESLISDSKETIFNTVLHNDNTEKTERQIDLNSLQHPKILPLMFTAISSIIPLFINTLTLFSLSGEIYANDTGILFFVFGLLISILMLAVSGILNILMKANISSVSYYLKKRYNSRASSYLVNGSAIVRHILAGALNVHVASLAAGAAMGISGTGIAFSIAVSAALCGTVGRIQTEHSYSIGSVWLAILTIITFVVLSKSTYDIGGFAKLIEISNLNGKIVWPSISAYPWEYHSYWGTTALGVFLGFQIFLLARASIKHLATLRSTTYYFISLMVVWLLVVLWVGLAAWGGLCSSVTFNEMIKNNSTTFSRPPIADGSLAVLIAIKLQHCKGFQGFFIASLIAASISGLTRRFNQMVAVFWETWNDISGRAPLADDDVFSEKVQNLVHGGASEDLINEVSRIYFKKKSFRRFLFQATTRLIACFICIGVLWILQQCHLLSWELWQGIVGVISGSIIGTLFLGVFFPCFPHKSVVVGLLIGWCFPCYLVIGNLYQSYQPEKETSLYKIRYAQFEENSFLMKNSTDNTIFDPSFRGTRHWMFLHGKLVEIIPITEEKITQLIPRSRNKFNKTKNIFHTSYCYYGLIGMMSCITAAFLFTIATNSCKQKKFHPELIHPLVHICLIRPSTTSSETKKTIKNRRAFAAFQEKAGF